MSGFLRTAEFDAWLKALREPIGKARILARRRAAQLDRFGDHASVGEAVFELRIHTGPGYRVYSDREEVIAECLNVALASEHPDLFLQVIADVAKARGMAQLAKDTGLGRERLYKALAPGAKPRYNTVLKVIRAFGVEFQMTPVPRKASRCVLQSGKVNARCARVLFDRPLQTPAVRLSRTP